MARDPETGQFVSDDSDTVTDYDIYDVQHFRRDIAIPAASNDGSTGAHGGQRRNEFMRLMDAAGGLNRGWVADLVRLEGKLLAWINSTQTADGTVQAFAQITSGNTSGDLTTVQTTGSTVDDGPFEVLKGAGSDVDSDLIMFLDAVGYGPITDGTNGVGGAGAAGEDKDVIQFDPDDGPTFGHDDDISLDIELAQWNVADAAIHATITGTAWWRLRRHPAYDDLD